MKSLKEQIKAHVKTAQSFIRSLDTFPVPEWAGQGIVTAAGSRRLFQLYVMVRSLRGHLACTLPVECFHSGPEEVPVEWRELLEPLGVTFTDIRSLSFHWRYGKEPVQVGNDKEMFPLKTLAIWYSRFKEVLWLDSDCIPVQDPRGFFDWPAYREKGLVLWPDIDNWALIGKPWLVPESWEAFGLKRPPEKFNQYPGGKGKWQERSKKLIPDNFLPWLTFETGQQLINKERCRRPLLLSMHYINDNYPWYRQWQFGEKDALAMSCRVLKHKFAVPPFFPSWTGNAYLHVDFDCEEAFYHRCQQKWTNGPNHTSGTPEEPYYCEYLQEMSRSIKSFGGYDWSHSVVNGLTTGGIYFLDVEEGAYGWYELIKGGACRSLQQNKEFMSFINRWETWTGPKEDDIRLVLTGPNAALELEWDERLSRWRGANLKRLTLTETAKIGKLKRRPLVCGIPTLNRYELLEKCIASILKGTIIPDRIFVIDNGQRYYGRYCLDKMVNVVRPLINLGVPRSFNLISKLAGESDTLILNDDLEIGPETIEKMLSVNAPVVCCFHWSGYLQTRGVWTTLGEYDENFYPAYFDDVDYRRRLDLAGIRTAHVYDPDVKHEYGASGGVSTEQWTKLQGYFRVKHARFERIR